QVSPDTKVSWEPVAGASGYRIHWRSTTAPQWEHSRDVAAPGEVLKGVVIDDWFFGVSAVAPTGDESPVVFPGPAGDFVTPPPTK
ncbi:MAG TPA: peptidase M28, partial [Phenylobacterium sp.]|nr:peptidase M28 [Phenylobacterium sp.]HQN51167.1 peptidase M28 [Phenylobacterium sp.]